MHKPLNPGDGGSETGSLSKKPARKRAKRSPVTTGNNLPKRGADPAKQSSRHLRPRTAEDIGNEETAVRLALRNWAVRQLQWYAEHPFTRFDVTFHKREPILEVTLNKSYARNLCAALMDDQEPRRLKELLDHVQFSDGTVVKASEIWTLNFIPDDLDVNGIDLARAEEVIGLGGETVREIIRDTYHCRSRAEEDHFIARWIAS